MPIETVCIVEEKNATENRDDASVLVVISKISKMQILTSEQINLINKLGKWKFYVIQCNKLSLTDIYIHANIIKEYSDNENKKVVIAIDVPIITGLLTKMIKCPFLFYTDENQIIQLIGI